MTLDLSAERALIQTARENAEIEDIESVLDRLFDLADSYERALKVIEDLLQRIDKDEEALAACSGLFHEIRNDWSDPRTECREGWAWADEAVAAIRAVRESILKGSVHDAEEKREK